MRLSVRPCAVVCVTMCDWARSAVRPCSTACGQLCDRVRSDVQLRSTVYGSFRAKYLCDDVRPCPTAFGDVRLCATMYDRVRTWSSNLVKLFFQKKYMYFRLCIRIESFRLHSLLRSVQESIPSCDHEPWETLCSYINKIISLPAPMSGCIVSLVAWYVLLQKSPIFTVFILLHAFLGD